jgi:hypothetical protein
MEMRPVLGVRVPVSETNRLPFLEMVMPSGPSKPEAICVTGHCPRAAGWANVTAVAIRAAIATPLWRMVLFCRFEFMLFCLQWGLFGVIFPRRFYCSPDGREIELANEF